MSVATDLQSVIDAKEAIRQAIIAKGVDVPAEAKLDTYHTYIDQISSAPEGDGTDWGTLYTTAYPDGLVLNSEGDFTALGNGGDSTTYLIVNGNRIRKNTFKKYSFGKLCKILPNYFLEYCTSLTQISGVEVIEEVGFGAFSNLTTNLIMAGEVLNFQNLTKIGNDFLGGCASLKAEVKIPKAETIGSSFMRSCRAYAQPLTIPSSVNTIAASFLSYVQDFTGLLTVETNVTPPANDAYSIRGQSSVSPCYTQGIRITGSGAAAWKAALPDSSSSYRKLILVEE